MKLKLVNLNDRMEFVLKFLVVASILFLVLYFGEKTYVSIIRSITASYYQFFKNIFGLKSPEHLYTDILLLQLVSFFALILVTPGIPIKRRLVFLLVGVMIFFTIDIFFTILLLTFPESTTFLFLVADFLKLALPFSLWFIFSYKYLLKFIEEKK